MSTHVARIAKVDSIAPIQGADRIQTAYVLGVQVIVSKEVQPGDVGVLFDGELALSSDYCKNNNLYRDKTKNKEQDKAGYLDNNGKIRVQKFLKVKSEALFMPVSSLEFTGYDLTQLAIGTTFDILAGIKICEKYMNERTRRFFGAQNNKKPKNVQAPLFREHVETEQLVYFIDTIPIGSVISIHHKQHGCVDKDTVIETLEHGNIRIQEIVERKLKCNIKAFDIVSQKEIFAPIDDHYYCPNSDDWYEIELENGQKIEITGNNPVWLPDLYCYRRAEDLKVGDDLLVV